MIGPGLNGLGDQLFVVVNKFDGAKSRAAWPLTGLPYAGGPVREFQYNQSSLVTAEEKRRMSSPVLRAVVEVFYEALSKRNMCTNATFLNDGRHQLSHRTLHQFRDDGGHRL